MMWLVPAFIPLINSREGSATLVKLHFALSASEPVANPSPSHKGSV